MLSVVLSETDATITHSVFHLNDNKVEMTEENPPVEDGDAS